MLIHTNKEGLINPVSGVPALNSRNWANPFVVKNG